MTQFGDLSKPTIIHRTLSFANIYQPSAYDKPISVSLCGEDDYCDVYVNSFLKAQCRVLDGSIEIRVFDFAENLLWCKKLPLFSQVDKVTSIEPWLRCLEELRRSKLNLEPDIFVFWIINNLWRGSEIVKFVGPTYIIQQETETTVVYWLAGGVAFRHALPTHEVMGYSPQKRAVILAGDADRADTYTLLCFETAHAIATRVVACNHNRTPSCCVAIACVSTISSEWNSSVMRAVHWDGGSQACMKQKCDGGKQTIGRSLTLCFPKTYPSWTTTHRLVNEKYALHCQHFGGGSIYVSVYEADTMRRVDGFTLPTGGDRDDPWMEMDATQPRLREPPGWVLPPLPPAIRWIIWDYAYAHARDGCFKFKNGDSLYWQKNNENFHEFHDY